MHFERKKHFIMQYEDIQQCTVSCGHDVVFEHIT